MISSDVLRTASCWCDCSRFYPNIFSALFVLVNFIYLSIFLYSITSLFFYRCVKNFDSLSSIYIILFFFVIWLLLLVVELLLFVTSRVVKCVLKRFLIVCASARIKPPQSNKNRWIENIIYAIYMYVCIIYIHTLFMGTYKKLC